MKLLKNVTSLQVANSIALQLKSRGILTFIANEDTKSLYPIAVINVGIWIVLDYQYDDAVAVLKNPEHIISQPLMPEEINRLSRDMRKPYSASTKSILKMAAILFIVVTLLCVASYFLRTTNVMVMP